MTEFAGRMQQGLKQTSTDFALMALRAVTCSVLGLTMALVVQEVMGQASEITLAFVFSFCITFGIFWRLTRGWRFATVLVFDLIAILTGLLLRLYVMVAPGA